MEIHIVIASIGDYSDNRTYPIAAYKDKALADKHEWLATLEVHRMQNVLSALKVPRWDVSSISEELQSQFINKYDKKREADDAANANYYVASVEVYDEIPDTLSVSPK